MLDLIGFWGGVTIITATFIIPVIATVLVLLKVLLSEALPEQAARRASLWLWSDADARRKVWEHQTGGRNAEGLRCAPPKHLRCDMVLGMNTGAVQTGPTVLLGLIGSGILLGVLLAVASEYEHTNILQSVAYTAAWAAPGVSWLVLLCAGYKGLLIIIRKVYDASVLLGKVNDTLKEKGDNE